MRPAQVVHTKGAQGPPASIIHFYSQARLVDVDKFVKKRDLKMEQGNVGNTNIDV